MSVNQMQRMVKEICTSKGIECTLVSKNWIMILKKKDKVRYIAGYKFDVNGHGVGQVCDDKYAFYDVLQHFHLPVAEHYIIFPKYKEEEILAYAKKYDYQVIVKSNTGTCGNDMYRVTNVYDLMEKIKLLLSKHSSISLSPYYAIRNEYRSIILDNRVELFYQKKRPIVIGDGKRTIQELLYAFHPYYFQKIQNPTWNRILRDKEVYEYNWQFNLSKGAIPVLVENQVFQNKIETLALQVAKILNLRFASIDIIELETGEFLILEANSGVMMENFMKLVENGEKIAYSIYEKAITSMFVS